MALFVYGNHEMGFLGIFLLTGLVSIDYYDDIQNSWSDEELLTYCGFWSLRKTSELCISSAVYLQWVVIIKLSITVIYTFSDLWKSD